MIATTCPTAHELEALSTGRLPDEQSDELLAHVRGCETCRAELETLPDGEDSLITSLRSLDRLAPFDEEPGCRVAVSKALGALALASDGAAEGGLDSLPRVIGEYEIVRPLGRGGMGSVYLARHTKLGREVALKVLAGHRLADPRTRERFEAEMRAVGRLSHPNIVTAHDAREVEGTAVLVTEYIDGLDLGQIVERIGPLETAEACEIGRRVAAALAYTSGQGFVHRDVKPSNIMLSRTGEVKLLDLGLARLQVDGLEQGVTGTGQTMGTADYVAPEQVTDSRSVDVRADIYSLGCTLFKLLSGTAPFASAEHATAFAKLTAHVSEVPPSLAERSPDAPIALVRLVDSMLAKDPAHRPQTPQTIAERLAAFTRNADLQEVVRQAETAGSLDSPTIPTSKLPASGLGRSVPLLGRKVPLPVAIVAGVLGLALGLCLGLMIKIEYPDGTVVRVPLPPGSQVTLAEASSGQASDARADMRSGDARPASTEFAPLQFAVLIEEDRFSAAQIERARERLTKVGTGSAVETAAGTWYPVGANVRVPVEAIHRGKRYALARHDTVGHIRWEEIRGKIAAMSISSELTFHFSSEELAKRVGEVSKSNLGRPLALVVDDEIIAAPRITSEISSQARFSGTISKEQIQYLMDALNGLVNVEADRSKVTARSGADSASVPAEPFSGLWHVVSIQRRGRAEVRDAQGHVLAFDENTYYTATGGLLTGAGTFWLDEEGPRKIIRLRDVREPAQPPSFPDLPTPSELREDGPAPADMPATPGRRSTNIMEYGSLSDDRLELRLDQRAHGGYAFVYIMERLGGVPRTLEQARALAEGKNDKLALAIMTIFEAAQVPPSALQFPTAEAWKRSVSQQKTHDNLRAIGLAFQQFSDTYGMFPGSSNRTGAPPQYDAEKIEPFSWRVAILPFVGEQALYEQYRFDEPWDSEHNRKLLRNVPDVYDSPYTGFGDKLPPPFGETHYQGFVGMQTALGENGGVPVAEFTDGMLLIAETRWAVPWTKPQDIHFGTPDDAKSVPPFEGAPLNYLTADGAVHSMNPIDWEKLAAMITRNGGEPVRP